MEVAQNVAVLFVLMAAGFAVKKLNIVSDEAVRGMSGLLLNVSMPALIISSLQKPFTTSLLISGLGVVGIEFALYALAVPLAMLTTRLVRSQKHERGVLEYGIVFGNVAFMGFPVVEAMFGPSALFQASLCIVPFNLLAFSFGAWMIARESHEPLKLSFGLFVNANTIGTLIGFAFFLFSFKLPAPIAKAFSLTGSLTTPLAMIITGAILARTDLIAAFRSIGVHAVLVVRLLVFPFIAYFILKMAGLQGHALAIPVILAAMPVAANTSILAESYGGNAEIGSALVGASTLLSALTIPLFATLLLGA